MLNQVKTLLGVEVKLEQMNLENGTVLEADAFEVGNEVFIVNEEDRIALPVGEYVLENGQILVVEEEGLIKEMKSENNEEEEIEVEAEEEKKEEMGYATKEELAEVKSMIEEIKAMLEPKEEMSEEVKEEKQELSSQEVVNEIPEEVKQELSEPAAEPINTNAEISKTEVKFNIASKRKMSTLDRVMNKINQL